VVLEETVSLALFAVTVGEEASGRIPRLFEAGEMAEGYIFDQVASFAADEMAQCATRRFGLAEKHAPTAAVLPYSPGYCGWNVSGQRALFAALQPDEIGVTINESCLMSPIKSVSGVLVLAPIEAHCFSPSFTCCATCTTLDCQERIASIQSP
jgi:cobalamin-dependent methionine synthase I